MPSKRIIEAWKAWRNDVSARHFHGISKKGHSASERTKTLKTYLIMRRENAERHDFAGGYLGCVDASSKQSALNKAAKRFEILKEQLTAFIQRS